MHKQEFKCKYMTINVTAIIDQGELTIKQGIRTWKTKISDLQHLFVRNHNGIHREILLSYKNPAGKLKRLHYYSDMTSPDFDRLVEALLSLRPDIDIRSLPIKEAYQKMGTVNPYPRIAVGLWVFITLIFVLVFLPYFIHGFDRGKQDIIVAESPENYKFTTSNLNIKGKLLTQYSVQLTTTHKKNGIVTSKSVSYFIPVVYKNWKVGESINMVVKTPDLNSKDYAKFLKLAYTSLPVVLRDTLWEGIDDKTKNFLINHYKLKLAKPFYLVEYAADVKFMFWVGIMSIGIVAVIMGIVAIYVNKKYN